MRGIRASYIILVLPFILSSCFKDDEPVTPHQPGNSLTDTISLMPTYKYQVYFDLSSHEVMASLHKDSWDLAFESTPGGFLVRLNSSNFMYAADEGIREIGLPADTAGAIWKFDKSDGNPDSTAIGNWSFISGSDTIGNNHVFALNLGLDDLGNARGYRQLAIDSISKGTYYFRTSAFDGTDVKSHAVSKDPSVNAALFSFDSSSGESSSEPRLTTWDLLFTQYTTLLFTDIGEAYPYLVTGVLLNPSGTEAAVDTVHQFESITYDIAKTMQFSMARDAIGYDWKYYNFDTGAYTVSTSRFYIIRDQEGFYYKLRFTGFYNKVGQKGFPSFEFQRL